MTFLNPAGLWGLLGVLALIIIYIIKPKFQEKIVSSTFVWKLSLKYKKKNVPLQWLQNSLLFLLQVLTLLAITFILAQPVIHSEDGSAEKIVILDASASMNAKGEDGTLFEMAVEEIRTMVSKLESYGTMTIIYAGAESSYLVEQTGSSYVINKALDNVSCSYSEADIAGAFELAGNLTIENSQAEVYLLTDKEYDAHDKVQVINLAQDVWNVAVLSLETAYDDERNLVFETELASYGQDAEVTCVLYIDDELADAQMVSLTDSQTTTVVFEGLEIRSYNTANIYLEVSDDLAEDNQYYLLQGQQQVRKILLVSSQSGFLQSVLQFFDNVEVTRVSSLEELDVTAEISDVTAQEDVIEEVEIIPSTGYDLYIYDGQIPETIPTDGAIWYINPDKAPEGTAFAIGEKVVADAYLTTAPNSQTEVFNAMTGWINAENVFLNEYTEITATGSYETIFLCNNAPVVLAGVEDGIRCVVLAFDIHSSNIALCIEFPELIYNMMEFSLPEMVEEWEYCVGESVNIQAVSSAVMAMVNGLDSSVTETFYTLPTVYELQLPGRYTVAETCADGTVETDTYFVHLSKEESNTAKAGGVLPVIAESTATVTYEMEITWWFVLLLVLLVVLEWGWQYREQY